MLSNIYIYHVFVSDVYGYFNWIGMGKKKRYRCHHCILYQPIRLVYKNHYRYFDRCTFQIQNDVQNDEQIHNDCCYIWHLVREW